MAIHVYLILYGTIIIDIYNYRVYDWFEKYVMNLSLSRILVPEVKQTALSTSSDKALGQSQKCE